MTHISKFKTILNKFNNDNEIIVLNGCFKLNNYIVNELLDESLTGINPVVLNDFDVYVDQTMDTKTIINDWDINNEYNTIILYTL